MAKTLELDRDLVEQVMKLRNDEEKKWDEINEITGVATGKLMLAYSFGSLAKKDMIKNATSADVVRLRDVESLSWGDIMVRTLLNEGTVRRLYTEGTKVDTKGLRIGKGGRHPGGADGLKAATAKGGGKAAGEKDHGLFTDVADSDVSDMLTGYAIKVDQGDGTTIPIKVKTVKKAAKGKVILVDGTTGESRTLKLSAISAISKRKVL